MDADTLDAIDNFISDASDQAAAWYSIIREKPVVLPSAQITSQTMQANQAPIASVVNTPLGLSVGSDPTMLLVLAAIAVGVFFLLKG